MKTCILCLEAKPLTEFHKSRNAKDGHNRLCKPCACLKTREWVALHPDRVAQNGRQNYLKNRAAYKARAKQWAAENSQRRRQIVRAWDERNRERKCASGRALNRRKYYADLKLSRATLRKNAALYRERHPEIVKARAKRAKARRRATVLGVQVDGVDFDQIKARDKMVCHLCKKVVSDKDLHFDHVIPLTKGGAHSHENIAVSHRWCNQTKGARIVSLF
jgi:5-methylcytosine-specific restriction endonuclease McrA